MAQAPGTPFVFVIMPLDPAWTDHYELGVRPACEAAGARCARLDEQIFLESILDRTYAQIESADLVVAEMTDRNPTVFYEAGCAHGLAKPLILLTKTTDDIPFDLLHHPHIVHGGSITTLKERLERHIRWSLENPEQARASLCGQQTGEQEELARMAAHIENYLNAHHLRMVTFARVRQNINATYSDEKLTHLIDVSPLQFRRVRLSGNRVGVELMQ
jgi:hypothetical protein